MSVPKWMQDEENAKIAKRERIAKKASAKMPKRQTDKFARLARQEAQEEVRQDTQREQDHEDFMIDTGRVY